MAVLAIEYLWPEATARAPFQATLWTQAARWEQHLREQVQGMGGVVLHHLPSLILVAFGLPQTLDQLPQRAVQTAVLLRHLGREGTDTAASPALRLAVHWGQVLVDGRASDPTAQLRAIGETLAWPVRLLGYAHPGEILVSHELTRLLAGWYELHARQVPGAGQPPECRAVYSVVGRKPQGSRLEIHGRRPLSRFVGREREVTTLLDLVTRVEAGRGHVVGLLGEPGVGKSRLSYEFVRRHVIPAWRCVEARAVAYGTATPYLPLRDLLTGYFQLADGAPASTIRTQVTSTLQTLDAALTPLVPALLTLLDVEADAPTWNALEPSQRRQHMFQAVTDLVLRTSQVQPVLVVVENLHWLDTETQAYLDTLVESLPTARLLLLVTYRPDYQHGWGNKTFYTQLRLDPLPHAQAHALLDDLLGHAGSLEPLKQRLIALTQGNPFFLEESVQSLIETGGVVGAGDTYQLGTPRAMPQVPVTVQAVLAARIDRLSAETKRLLQTAAVIGMEVPAPLWQTVAELSAASLQRGVAPLQAAEFLYAARLGAQHAYTFKHAMTHDVAYQSLGEEHRRRLHARIVAALETRAGECQGAGEPGQGPEPVAWLAHHAVRGEVWDKALRYCRQAGEKAMAQSAYREAVGYFEQALSALPHLPDTRARREQAVDLWLALRYALRPLGDFDRILAALRQAEAQAAGLDDPHRRGQVSIILSAHLRLIGLYEEAVAAGQRALGLATASGDGGLQALANEYTGYAYVFQGAYPQALACVRQAVAFFAGVRCHERYGQIFLPAVLSRALAAQCYTELGAFTEGRAVGEAGLQIAEADQQPATRLFAAWGLGYLARRQGDLPRALAHLERAMGLCQDADLPAFFPWLAPELGAAYTLAGRVAEAVPLLRQALAQTTVMARVDAQVLGRLALGEALLLAGGLEEAQALAAQAHTLAGTHQEHGHRAYALHLLGAIAVQREPPESEEAHAHYRQALILAEELGMRPLQAHCHRGLGLLYAMMSQQAQAHTELSTAMEMYQAMDMTFWLPQTEAALAQVDTR